MVLAALLGLWTFQVQADYQDGLDAYAQGDYATAMAEWRSVAEGPATAVNPAVYVEAHYAVGMLYWKGEGVPQDYSLARHWLLKAANMNHAGAEAKLGYLYTDGLSVPQDLARAFEWFARAARQGDVDGQYNLGIFYLNGWGTEPDPTQARLYLAAAAAQGDEAAEAALGRLLAGDGTATAGEPRVDAATETRVIESEYPAAGRLVADNTESRAERAPTGAGESVGGRSAADSLRDEAWILARDPEHYTLQVMALSSRDRVEALIADEAGLAPWAVYTVPGVGRPLHVLVQGDYADLAAARSAQDSFPGHIQSSDQLWVRKFAMVQNLVAQSLERQ